MQNVSLCAAVISVTLVFPFQSLGELLNFKIVTPIGSRQMYPSRPAYFRQPTLKLVTHLELPSQPQTGRV